MKQEDYQSVVNQNRQSTEYSFGERIAYHHQGFSESLKSHLMTVSPSSILSRQLASRRQWSERLAMLLGGLSRKISRAFRPDVLFRSPLDLILLRPFTRITKGFYGREYPSVNSTVQGPGNTSLQAHEGQGYEGANTSYSTVLPEARQRNTIPDITEHKKYSHAAEEYIPAGEMTNVPGTSQFASAQRDRLHQTPQQIPPTRMPQYNVSAFAHSKLVEGKIPGSPSSLPVSPVSNGMPAVAQPTGLPPIAFGSQPADTAQSDSHHPADSGDKEYSPSNTEMSHATDIASTSGKDKVHYNDYAGDTKSLDSAVASISPHIPLPALPIVVDSHPVRHHNPYDKPSTGDLSLTESTDRNPDQSQGDTKRTSGGTAVGIPVFKPATVGPETKMMHKLLSGSRRIVASSPVRARLVETGYQRRQMPFTNTDFTRIMADRYSNVPVSGHPVQTVDREYQHEETGIHSGERLSTSFIRRSGFTLNHWQDTPQEVAEGEAARATITESMEGITPSDVSSRRTIPTNPEEIRTSNENKLMLPGLRYSRIETLSQKSSLPIDKGKEVAKTGSQSAIEEYSRQMVSSAGAPPGTDRAIVHSVTEGSVPLFGSPITDETEETPVRSRVFPHRVNIPGYTSLMADEHLARSIPHRYHMEESITLSPLKKSLHSVERLNTVPSDTVSPTESVEIGRPVNDYEESVSQHDTEALAREVYAILKRQFATERERLGAGFH
jgi:hypothetical protein